MSTDVTPRDYGPPREIRYEVSSARDVVNVTFQKGGRELTLSTNPQSALLLASDLITAVDHSTLPDTFEETGFVFNE